MGHFARVNDFNGLSVRVRQILRTIPRLLRLYGSQVWPLPLSRKGVLRFYWERLCAVGLVSGTGRKGDTAPRIARLIQSVAREVFAGSIIFESV